MNTMKKWVVAGLIGLFSAAVSMATTYLDLNTFDSDAQWNPSHIAAAQSGTTFENVYSTGDWETKTPHRLGGIAAGTYTQPMSGYGDINGSAMTFSFTRSVSASAAQMRTAMNLTYTYTMPGANQNSPAGEFSGLNMANWNGVVIDFAGVADADLANIAGVDMILGLTTWVGTGWYTINLDNHIGGTTGSTFAWSDFGVPEGFDPVTDLTEIKLYYDVDTTYAGNALGFTFTETINSFKLYGDDPPPDVPEPETVWMIVAVLASLGVTFRRQLMDLAGRFVKA